MSQKFWAKALLCFTYAWNRVCHKNKKTPFEFYSGRKPSISHLKKFGCVAYVGVHKQTRKKLNMRAKLGIMCGYAQTTKGYRILLLEDQRVLETINVRFDETKRGVELVPDSKGSRFTLFKDFPEDGDTFSLTDDDLINRSESPRVVESASKPIVEIREITSLEQNVIPCKSIDWVHKARSDGSRIDIYYGIEGTNIDSADNRDDRVSIDGYILFLDETPISWRTFKQSCGGAGTGLPTSRYLSTKRGSLSSSTADDGLILPEETLNDDSQA
ncbi:hypothetical protein AVEN_229013-1 [Araneus ventricosus]|uniref:Retroviral polymerase SH3-like domain-containing protein n=1 Tax=Araneus ventricosus TaxID=182803 RepID=A0A4Y2KMB6_ARAVE|nr:hypothetical protein AVEN_229013-1 [Araneus ventricosus]